MKCRWYEQIDEFAQETWGLLVKDEIENNLLMGNIKREQGGGRPNQLRVVIGDEKIRLIGVMTEPFNLVLYEVDHEPCEEALLLLVEELIKKEIPLPGVIGESTLVHRFRDYYSKRVNKKYELKLGLNLMVLEKVIEPKRAKGKMRLATEADLYFLPYWQRSFAEEAGVSVPTIEESIESLKKSIALGRIYIWEDEYPVSSIMGGRALENAIGIGFVYTPPMYRGKGYASSCVAEGTKALLRSGYKQCYLFADQKNPISNGIYQRIGYENQCIFEEIMFRE